MSVKRMTKRELRLGALMYPEEPSRIRLPMTRGDCVDAERPCPFVSCKHHLYLDVSPRTGSIKLNFPDLEPWELEHSCALDAADRGGLTLEEAAERMNITRERLRQLEVKAFVSLRQALDEAGLTFDELTAEQTDRGINWWGEPW